MMHKKYLSLACITIAALISTNAQAATPTAPALDQNYCTHDFSVNSQLTGLANGLCSAGQSMLSMLASYQTNSAASSTSPLHNLASKLSFSAPATPAPAPVTTPQSAQQPATTNSGSANTAPQTTAAGSNNPYAYS
ncbi:MAG: hypothetical protein K0S08_1051 [Gammaproteobacteria bacterium]|jgi:hypothetical protein|nr:hypothetical protein [Gammaproteobacteria bacterium]